MTEHSHINSNKQIQDKVQPSALKTTTGFGGLRVFLFGWVGGFVCLFVYFCGGFFWLVFCFGLILLGGLFVFWVFLVDVKETGIEENQACRNFTGNFKPR